MCRNDNGIWKLYQKIGRNDDQHIFVFFFELWICCLNTHHKLATNIQWNLKFDEFGFARLWNSIEFIWFPSVSFSSSFTFARPFYLSSSHILIFTMCFFLLCTFVQFFLFCSFVSSTFSTIFFSLTQIVSLHFSFWCWFGSSFRIIIRCMFVMGTRCIQAELCAMNASFFFEKKNAI